MPGVGTAAFSAAVVATVHLHADVTLNSLLVEMMDFGAVARWPQPEFTCRQASSYDRGTVAPDQPGWFANSDQNQFIRTRNLDGILRFRVNDRPLMAMLDCHADAVQPAKPFVLGVFAPLDGRFKLCAEVAGANAASTGARYFSGPDCVMLEKP